MDDRQADVCRVCRSEGSHDKPLYHPCVCTGSIKYIHQDCLVQWLKYSKKEYCELCKHRYLFTPIYAPDMPKRLPIRDIVGGLVRSIARAVRYWLHYTLVAVAWLGIVPLTACRIYRCLFTGSVSSILTLPLDMLSTENLLSDCFQGCFVVTCTLCTFISLVWLREQILHGGGPEWLEQDHQPLVNNRQNANPADAAAAGNDAAAADGNAAGNDDVPVVENPAAADEDAEEEHVDEDIGNNGAQADENNWNPIEWDRAAEELTWERLLGLDGSLLFMEHVFWVVSLNTLFIMIFAFCPYHIGHFTVSGLKVEEMMTATKFDGLLTTLLGYLITAIALVFVHGIVSLVKLKKPKRILGLCYIAIKVSLLVVMEIGMFPLVCGWWLDICSLSMFDATLKDREHSFRVAPGTSMFIHWLVGMVYIFYFASFILLLREVLRPGVLWFLRNLNDPDFNPIQEMIHLPVYRHIRRFVASMVVFGTIVLIMLWLPVQLIQKVFPTFLPFHVMLSSFTGSKTRALEMNSTSLSLEKPDLRSSQAHFPDTPVSELSLELLLLQVILPALLEQGHTRQWLKGLIRGWCIAMAWILDLRSYLLGDVPEDDEDVEPAADEPDELGAERMPEQEVPPAGGVNDEAALQVDNGHPAAPEAGVKHAPEADAGNAPVADVEHAPEADAGNAPEVAIGDARAPEVDTETCARGAGVGEAGDHNDVTQSVPPFEVAEASTSSSSEAQDSTIKSVQYPSSHETPVVRRTCAPDALGTSVDGSPKQLGALEGALEGAHGESAETVNDTESLDFREHSDDPVHENVDVEPDRPAVEVVEVVEEVVVEELEPVVVDPAPLAEAPPPQPVHAAPLGLGDAHQAMMQGGGPTGYQPYVRPNFFFVKLLCLILMMCVTLFLASLISFVVPVYIGRKLMSFWTGKSKVHELYTAACGLYSCWVALRVALVLFMWIPQGWRVIMNKVIEWGLLVSKSLFIATVLIGVIPLILGLLFELIIVVPIRVPLDQTPIFFLWQDWALGVLHAKIITAGTLMGPQWRLKRVIEQVYNQGLRNMDLKYVMTELCLPVLVYLGLLLCIPYIVAKSLVPALGFGFEIQNLVLRRIYPFLLGIFLFVLFCVFQARQFRRLYEHIKNDKYLVGQRLVNYERRAA